MMHNKKEMERVLPLKGGGGGERGSSSSDSGQLRRR